RGGFPSESLLVRSNFVATDVGMNSQPGENAVFIGRLSGEKGVSTVLEAWQKRRIDIPLIIIGDGPDRAALEAEAVGNPNIVFTGRLSTQNVTQHLVNARVLIMPSICFETFGRTMAEAFAQGIPVIASRLGTMIELVDNGRNGFLFEPGNANELAEATF
nr:glycosyltransferase family 4 protein [Pirellula sp.]